MQRDTMKLVEECAGVGELVRNGEPPHRVRYSISRYQGMLEGSGMPIPGLYKVEGSIDADPGGIAALVGRPVTLRLQDGRSVAVTVVDAEGRILSEGHGPGRGCSCC